MSIRDEIIQLIRQESPFTTPITEATNLYQDLKFDSLSFVSLLVNIEKRYHITIELPEMERCLAVGQLITVVERQLKGENV